MSREVLWNKLVLETFIKEGCMTNEQEMVLRLHTSGYSRQKIAMDLNMSLSTVDRHIKRLKILYDSVAKYNPILPPRQSLKERKMLGADNDN